MQVDASGKQLTLMAVSSLHQCLPNFRHELAGTRFLIVDEAFSKRRLTQIFADYFFTTDYADLFFQWITQIKNYFSVSPCLCVRF